MRKFRCVYPALTHDERERRNSILAEYITPEMESFKPAPVPARAPAASAPARASAAPAPTLARALAASAPALAPAAPAPTPAASAPPTPAVFAPTPMFRVAPGGEGPERHPFSPTGTPRDAAFTDKDKDIPLENLRLSLTDKLKIAELKKGPRF